MFTTKAYLSCTFQVIVNGFEFSLDSFILGVNQPFQLLTDLIFHAILNGFIAATKPDWTYPRGICRYCQSKNNNTLDKVEINKFISNEKKHVNIPA